METVTIRDLRQNWPAVERRLASAGELTVTRDGTAVAVLATPRIADRPSPRSFDPAAHARRIRKLWGQEPPAFTSERILAEERADRSLGAGPG
jgi:antitoxin (DNA-binding transcriptional repressor) of toxin-antitoxin stability system